MNDCGVIVGLTLHLLENVLGCGKCVVDALRVETGTIYVQMTRLVVCTVYDKISQQFLYVQYLFVSRHACFSDVFAVQHLLLVDPMVQIRREW
jgi:hypothetical protein